MLGPGPAVTADRAGGERRWLGGESLDGSGDLAEREPVEVDATGGEVGS